MHSIGFIKRLLIIIYDALLLVGVIMVGYGFLFLIAQALIPSSWELGLISKIAKTSYLCIATFVFYGWFWTHGGQTLGMKAWGVYLVYESGKFISWKSALIRFCSAIISWAFLGLGFTWILLNKRNLAWHDNLSKTYIVRPANPPA